MTAISKISGAQPINFKKVGANGTPIETKINPATIASTKEVPIVRLALVKSFAPTYFAKTTLEPIEKATKKLTP